MAGEGEFPSSSNEQHGDEEAPEIQLLLAACGVGLAAGASIVGFNLCIHAVQSLISHEFLGNAEPWILLVLPPALGGVAVGLLGVAVGGYDDPPTPGSKEALPGPQGEPEEQAASVRADVFQVCFFGFIELSTFLPAVSHGTMLLVNMLCGADISLECSQLGGIIRCDLLNPAVQSIPAHPV